MFQRVLWGLWRRSGYIKFVQKKLDRNPLIHKDVKKSEKLVLNAQQKEAYEQIEFMLENEEFAEFLMHGITGSRKDRDLFTID